ncbi:MAG: DUF2254 domain-containing protein [Proteobacteria bacterium]|nr:DUF2254 domain-containing protein [Pseudomonadota bacterium]
MIVVGAVVLAFALVQIDERLDLTWLTRWSHLFGAGAEGSRGMLEAIATSMITVAGVTFSITIAALAQASSQYSPLVLRNFMRDRANQVVLGAFGGIFVYCLIVLRSIRSGSEEFVPSVAVSAALLLSLLGIALLVFFVHHIASTLQASSILANIATSARATMDADFPPLAGAAALVVCDVPDIAGADIKPRRSGYVQDIRFDSILDLAERYDAVVRLEFGVGDFAIAELPAARLMDPTEPDADLVSGVQDAIIIGDHRTSDRDLAFAIRQIVDMAVKALSPGINDPTTANFCLHHLSAILVTLGDRAMPQKIFCAKGRLRVIAQPPTYRSLVDLAIAEVRQNAGPQASVLVGVAVAIEAAARTAIANDRREALLHQLRLTEAEARRALPDGEPLRTVLARIASSVDSIAGNG